MTEFLSEAGPGPVNVVLGVFERGRPHFSFVATLNEALTQRVTGFEYWTDLPAVEFTAESLDNLVQAVESSDGPVASALFIERADLERLWDGERHDSLPGSLIVGGRAFGISNMPGVAERGFSGGGGIVRLRAAVCAIDLTCIRNRKGGHNGPPCKSRGISFSSSYFFSSNRSFIRSAYGAIGPQSGDGRVWYQ